MPDMRSYIIVEKRKECGALNAVQNAIFSQGPGESTPVDSLKDFACRLTRFVLGDFSQSGTH